MKLKIYYIGLLVVLVLSISSCGKDFLDTRPSDQISQEDMFSSMANVKVAMNGVYRGLYRQYDTQEQDGQAGIMIFMDFMGEDVVHYTSGGTTYYRDGYRWIDHTTSSGGLSAYAWRFYYKIISDVNEILGGIGGVEGTEAEKNAIIAECLALRAWGHFNLVQMFGGRYNADEIPNSQVGVAILLKSTIEPQPRATVDEVYAQINADLNESIRLFANTPQRVNKTHVDLSVAKGFKARVALTMQDWPLAAQMAREARTAFGLMSNPDYLSGFNTITNSEWMWGANQLADQLPAYGSFYAYMSGNFNSAHTRPNPKLINKLLWDALPSTDIRKKIWWDGTKADSVNFPGVINASSGLPDNTQRRSKYMHRKFMVKDPAVSVGDIPFMRSAEMYLIEAEALARQSQFVEAWEALKPLALNRDPSINKTSVSVNDVLLQRRVELWGEGFRFLDLKRTNANLSRTSSTSDITNPSIATRANVTSVLAGDARWQFKIPLRELQTNPLITQNP